MRLRAAVAVMMFASSALGSAQQHPRDAEIHDADTLGWWHTTEALSNDSMQGRDTGTAAYQRAADLVAKRFAVAGLKPAGERGTYFQSVPMHEIDLTPEGTSFTVVRGDGTRLPLQFLEEITTGPSRTMLTHGEGVLSFRGYCGAEAMSDIAGKIILCFGTQRQGLPSGAERLANARKGGALGIVNIDDPYFTIEPPRWPYAYARSVTLTEPGHTQIASAPGSMLPAMRLSAAAFAKLLNGTGRDAAAILKTGGAQGTLEPFDLPARLDVTLHTTEKDISSPNVLAVLPGADPALRDQYVVVAAHLDGYGFGTPVMGDNLYNGTLDDAAYVALLIQMAEDLQAGKDLPPGANAPSKQGSPSVKGTVLSPPKRSILFCAFTGEEKGLLGSTWFVEHPTVPVAQLAADVNLDQLRPLFPLKILTALAIHDTTLGAPATQVGAGMGIALREDREPERGLLRRADHYPFLKAGVPAIGFVFGFDPGTDAEQRYRHWYEVQYHRPQDDLTQPVNFEAAAKFDAFFYRLVETVADDPERPRVLSPIGKP
ncbi:MAG: M28 family peptidase [Janthinobacterium lividum]